MPVPVSPGQAGAFLPLGGFPGERVLKQRGGGVLVWSGLLLVIRKVGQLTNGFVN